MTGGGGYVGSSLCRKLVERGYTVVAFDLHCSGEDQTDSIHRIKVSTSMVFWSLSYALLHYFYSPQGDIREKESLISAINHHRPDVVFHLASYGMSGREMVSGYLNNFCISTSSH